MSPRMPVKREWIETDKSGRVCKIEVSIEQTQDFVKYPPDGKKCIFRVFREKAPGAEEFNIVLLVDNHAPFGFHYHDRLPTIQSVRKSLVATTWKEAWSEFQVLLKELLCE